MRRSRSISLTLMAGLAAACAGDQPGPQSASADWGDPAESRVCADTTGRVVPDEECARPRSGGFYPFLYYYGGSRLVGANGAAYVRGATPSRVGVGSGRVLPMPRGPVSRGGFGSTVRGRAGSLGG